MAISTGGTKLFMPGGAAYLGSKGAAEQFVRTLAYELAAQRLLTREAKRLPVPNRDCWRIAITQAILDASCFFET